MRIITPRTIREYYLSHADAETGLEHWICIAKNAEWRTLADIKKDYNSVDYVGNSRYVFNISGNSYRLVVLIRLLPGVIYVRWIGTHAEYDKIDCTTI